MGLIHFLIQGLIYVILADVILSWVMPNPEQFPRSVTRQITDPLYRPVRAILDPQKLGGFDLSPIIIIVLLNVLERILLGAL